MKKKKSLLLFVFLSAIFLRACTSPGSTTSPQNHSSLAATLTVTQIPQTQTPTLTLTPSPSPTLDDQSFRATWLTSRPRDMESYGMVYDPNATAELPPRDSPPQPHFLSRAMQSQP